jgi:hypothetical protein
MFTIPVQTPAQRMNVAVVETLRNDPVVRAAKAAASEAIGQQALFTRLLLEVDEMLQEVAHDIYS